MDILRKIIQVVNKGYILFTSSTHSLASTTESYVGIDTLESGNLH